MQDLLWINLRGGSTDTSFYRLYMFQVTIVKLTNKVNQEYNSTVDSFGFAFTDQVNQVTLF